MCCCTVAHNKFDFTWRSFEVKATESRVWLIESLNEANPVIILHQASRTMHSFI